MRSMLATGISVVGLLAAAGCSTASPVDPLRNTTWRLVSIESMAPNESPSTVIDDPAKYTVDFGGDGRAFFQIDCNRGNSTFEAVVAGPDSGTLTFGPIALTKMACAQPSSDAVVTAALGRVRSYLISDGKLHLSMEADSGILHWDPASS